ncbi:MAG: DUF4157 domain-containing protein [Bacteroidota bacterium]
MGRYHRIRRKKKPETEGAARGRLEVGAPADEFEREADRTADQVTQSTGSEEKEKVQTQPQGDGPSKIGEDLEEESLQAKPEEEEGGPVRMQPMEEEEEEVMMQPAEEEEEQVQTKAHSEEEDIKMQPLEEEEEMLQAHSEQQEEDEQVQTKAQSEEEEIKMQPMEEEEGMLQAQSMEEEEEMLQAQPLEEEEEVQMQVEEEEEEMMQMEAEEEEEEVQAKEEESEEEQLRKKPAVQLAEDGQRYATQGVSKELDQRKSGGDPLNPTVQQDLGSKMGADFDDVRVHKDEAAASLSDRLGARAFTHGNHIYFNRGQYDPGSSAGRHLLAHELTHVIQQKGTGEQVSKQGLLTAAQEQAAINYNNARYDLRSKMIIQNVVGSIQDGLMGSQTVEDIATFQTNNGLTVDGMVGPQTLEAMFQNRIAANFFEHAIQLVVDLHNLNLADTLSITHDPSLIFSLANTTFEPGGQRVIKLGVFSFLTSNFLKTIIQRELALPAPPVAASGPRPTHLNAAQEADAIRFNRIKYTTSKAVRGMQGLIGSVPADGIIGADTVERIADYQSNHGLTIDGKAGENTLRQMVADLDARMEQNAAIHMIMDFYNMSTFGALLDISYDHNLTGSNASTGGIIPGPSIVKIGRPGFSQGFEGLVHTIAHELEHVRQRKEGILNRNVREFLGEAVEIVSANMPEENVAGFFSDARRALHHWNLIPAAEQRTHWARFVEVRNQVRRRHGLASAAEQVTHQPTLNGYNTVAQP